MDVIGWYNETPTLGVGTVSKIHYTRDGITTLCGVRPGRNAVFDIIGSEGCSRCEDKQHKLMEDKERKF